MSIGKEQAAPGNHTRASINPQAPSKETSPDVTEGIDGIVPGSRLLENNKLGNLQSGFPPGRRRWALPCLRGVPAR